MNQRAVGHQAAVYRTYVWADGDRRRPCLLSNFDGLGNSLQGLIAAGLPDLSVHGSFEGIHSCTVNTVSHETFAMLCHDEQGVSSVISGQNGSVRRAAGDVEHVRCGALFKFPADSTAGWLAIHVNHGRDVMPALQAGLQALVARSGRFLEFFPSTEAWVMDQAMRPDSRERRDILKFVVPADPAVADAEPWVNSGSVGREGIVPRPHLTMAEQLIRRVPPSLRPPRQSVDAFVEFRGASPGDAADPAGNGAEGRASHGHGFPMEMVGLAPEPTAASIAAELRRAIAVVGRA